MRVFPRFRHSALRGSRCISAAALLVLASGCATEPRVGRDSLADGQERVAELVDEARAAMGPNVDNPDPDPINPSKPCRKTVAGYSVGEAGTRAAERLALVLLEPGSDPNAAREAAVAVWDRAGYTVDRSEEGIYDGRFVRTRAIVDADYEVMVTAFADPIKLDGVDRPQVAIYAVSACLRA